MILGRLMDRILFAAWAVGTMAAETEVGNAGTSLFAACSELKSASLPIATERGSFGSAVIMAMDSVRKLSCLAFNGSYNPLRGFDHAPDPFVLRSFRRHRLHHKTKVEWGAEAR